KHPRQSVYSYGASILFLSDSILPKKGAEFAMMCVSGRKIERNVTGNSGQALFTGLKGKI
ncbi:MAG: hypothetical protein WAX45_01470, partial [Trichococcus flocculiformis]